MSHAGRRWISDLVYVFGAGGGSDELHMVMQGFDSRANHVQLTPMTRRELDQVLQGRQPAPQLVTSEPAVPYRSSRWEDFRAEAPFDFACLTRSPPYTPPAADPLFDAIRSNLIRDIGTGE